MEKVNFQKLARPFVIAEMSGNHNQSRERALAIVDAAADAGVDALKLQTYTADTMTLDIDEGEFHIGDDSLWSGESLYSLYKKAYTPWEWHEKIFERCREKGIYGFSTPFDLTAVDFLEKLNVPFYKVASFENIDIPLIRRIAKTGKPIIASTGMATVAELDDMIRTARDNGCQDITLLKCTSSYPASPKGTNLKTIPHLKDLFGCQVGLSDHTLGTSVAVASIGFGAMVIEKHFTLSRADGGVDSAFSLEPQEMAALVRGVNDAYDAIGEVSYGPSKQEMSELPSRRSLYITADIKKGEAITDKNMRSIRPGLGLSPKYYDVVMGKKVGRDVKRGMPLSWDMIE